jgi:energy-coupling factor transporter transmembrane protein EcfT
MKLKLIRLANVFNHSFHRSFIILFAVIAISTVCFKFRWDFVFSGLVLLLVYSIIFPIFNYPKYVELYDNRICYVSPENIPRKRGKGFISVKVSYQVTDITSFTLERNKAERLFGLAHVVFRGKTTLDAGKHTGRFRPKDVHCVYGIRYNKHKDDISLYCKYINLSSKK